MRIIIFFFMTFFFVPLFACQNDLFTRGLAAYEKKDFQKAAEYFKMIDTKTPAVWFNLALCATQENKKIDAVVFWLRAWHQGRGALREQAFAQALAMMDVLDIKQQFLQTMPRSFWNKIPALMVQILFLMMLALVVIFAGRLARKKRWYMLGALMVVTVLTAAICYKSCAVYQAHYALVVKENASLYAGPDEQFELLQKIPMGSVVTIKKYAQGWYMISTGGIYGWSVATTLALLDETH